eukprot:NODE_1221_length_645_cov_184.560403_g958_i0.p2 GENE.NODE_1221_length_645_cov_184.560403_g958_i0~~NODE_1221_length_645_cov_184.560403_g958_i0.p2  ORF type:complete len:74 (-),score=0.37 NODE_1221_length_645_cov_184.560403_g958_i0:238-459(-)
MCSSFHIFFRKHDFDSVFWCVCKRGSKWVILRPSFCTSFEHLTSPALCNHVPIGAPAYTRWAHTRTHICIKPI